MKRQGISILHTAGSLIEGCHVNNTRGMLPAAGIDLEENLDTKVINNKIQTAQINKQHIVGYVSNTKL